MGIIINIKPEEKQNHQITYAVDTSADAMRLGRVVFKKGARIPEKGFSTHNNDEYTYVAKGSIIFGTEEGEYTVGMGSFHFIPKKTKHWCKSIEEESHLVFVMID